MNQTPPLNSCLGKQQQLKQLFSCCPSSQQRYEKIIELGRTLEPYQKDLKTPSHLVSGCQSVMYLDAQMQGGKVRFLAYSEALISAGLAAVLLFVYNDETPETILTCPPLFLEELGISASLSPSRSNGLASLFKTMQQRSLNFLV